MVKYRVNKKDLEVKVREYFKDNLLNEYELLMYCRNTVLAISKYKAKTTCNHFVGILDKLKLGIDNPSYKSIKTKVDVIITSWICIGGYSGGNCWDDTIATYHRYDDAEIPKIDVEGFLKKEYPKISFLYYVDLLEELSGMLIKEERSDYEYYGNTSDYKANAILLPDLVDLLYKYLND